MHIKTPKMIAREIFESAGVTVNTYMDALERGMLTMRGSSTTIQDDFIDWEVTPDTFDRGTTNLPSIKATSITATSNGLPVAAGEDCMAIIVGKPDNTEATFGYTLGSPVVGTEVGIAFSYLNTTGRGGVIDDDTASGFYQVTTGATSGKLAAANNSDVYAYVGAYDISAAFASKFYNLDNSSETLSSASGTHGKGAVTPNATYTISGISALYGILQFIFPSGLPGTWETDGLAIANAIKTYQEQ